MVTTAKYLHGMHDPGGENLMADKPGWIVFTVSLSANERIDFGSYVSRGFVPIVRLNWGYGSTGTIPKPDQYDEMAAACQQFVSASPDAEIFIIGNEPNHINERPAGEVITPENYARCFNLCRDMIRAIRPSAEVLMAAIAPWNEQTGDWVDYFKRCALLCDCDGFALHAYTHGADPALVTSDIKVHGWYWHFHVYRTQLYNVPPDKRKVPAYITESNQGDNPWVDAKTGYVPALMRDVYDWNQQAGTQKIRCVALYRWSTADEDQRWAISTKPQVQADFAEAARMGFLSPLPIGVTPPVPAPQPPDTPDNANETWPLYWDERLDARGVVIERPSNLVDGQLFYDVLGAKWLDKNQAGGRHHIYTNAYDQNHTRLMGTHFLVQWPMPDPNNRATIVAEKNEEFSANYPMSKSLREYSIKVQEEVPSSILKNIGMGQDGNPAEHTSTIVEFQLRRWKGSGPGPTPPDPEPGPTPEPEPPMQGRLILPARGTRTQRWGENAELYNRLFGIPYHNGLDIAAPEGTDIVAIADGEVLWVDNDPSGYGNYLRVYHPGFLIHSFMGHMSRVDVKVGQQVKQGQKLGAMGNTGNSTGPHVHFEIRLGTKFQYAEGTFGHRNGRVDPETVMYFFG